MSCAVTTKPVGGRGSAMSEAVGVLDRAGFQPAQVAGCRDGSTYVRDASLHASFEDEWLRLTFADPGLLARIDSLGALAALGWPQHGGLAPSRQPVDQKGNGVSSAALSVDLLWKHVGSLEAGLDAVLTAADLLVATNTGEAGAADRLLPPRPGDDRCCVDELRGVLCEQGWDVVAAIDPCHVVVVCGSVRVEISAEGSMLGLAAKLGTVPSDPLQAIAAAEFLVRANGCLRMARARVRDGSFVIVAGLPLSGCRVPALGEETAEALSAVIVAAQTFESSLGGLLRSRPLCAAYLNALGVAVDPALSNTRPDVLASPAPVIEFAALGPASSGASAGAAAMAAAGAQR